ncbi:MAG: hypothetical protein H6637_05040 [Ardenticatenales bacterium]|nr:hypothetical protein [Ardenticatenales bacterium]
MADRSNGPALGRWLAFATSLVILALLARRFLHNTDDLFINLRYGYFIGEGWGPIFNSGERVEGYTAALWVTLLALFHALGVDLLKAGRLLSFLGGLCSVALLWPLTLQWRWRGSALALLLLATTTSFAVWTSAAMDMTAYTALLLAALVVVGARRWAWAGIVLALATMMRPEGAMWTLLILGYALVARRGEEVGARWRGPAFAFALWLVPTLLHIAFRLVYYGYPLPNTFYVKAALSTEVIGRGLHYLGDAAFDYRWSLTPALLLALLTPATWRRHGALLWLLIAAQLAYAMIIGGDWMTSYRFLIPTLPLIAVQIARALAAWTRPLPNPQRSYALLGTVMVGLLLLTATQLQPKLARDPFFTQPWVPDGKEMAELIGVHCQPGTSIAVFAAGSLPYYLLPADFHIVDMFGLTTVEIAHAPNSYIGGIMPGHGRFSAETTRQLDPDLYIFHAEFDATAITDETGWRVGGLSHLIQQFTDDPAFWSGRSTRTLEVAPGEYFNFVQKHDAACSW